MKFSKKQVNWQTPYYVGKRDGFIFEYKHGHLGWYVTVSHTKKDIRFNTLWPDPAIGFNNEMEVQQWCRNFDYTNYECLGKDV